MKRLLWLIPLILLLAGAWLLSRQFTVTVLVAPALTGKAVNAVTGTVEVFANLDVDVKVQHRGVLDAVPVGPGRAVNAGDVVAVQSSEDLDLRLEQVQIRLEAARERDLLENRGKIDLEALQEQIRGVELSVRLGQAPETRLNDLLRQERKLQVNVELERIREREELRILDNQLQQLQLQKRQMTTLAPFAGTVAVQRAFAGDLLNAGQSVLRLISKGRFLLMELTEEDYFGVVDGQAVTLRLASYPDRTFAGTVSRLEGIADAGKRTRNVIVAVGELETELAPGLTGEGYLVKGERTDAVLIPRRALVGGRVYVVANGRVEIRRVHAGYVGLNQVEIIDGIRAGEQVVLEDQNLLKDGHAVRIREGS